MKKTQFIACRSLVNTETGEEKSLPDKAINLPKCIKLKTKFIKVEERAINTLNRGGIGNLSKLYDNLEWQTNRLAYIHVGRTPKPLKHKDMAAIIGVSERTITSFYSRLHHVKGIFKFDDGYYVNPTFASISHFYHTDIIIRMMKEDPHLEKYINKADLKDIKSFKRIENLNW